jgi:hypothetical protein
MANEIVWYSSDEVNAPVQNTAAGSLDAVLYACLVTGFNAQTLTSVTVASNVATATKSAHGYSDGRMLDLSGAGTAAINGRKKITVTGVNTFTFDATGVADGTISGTITAKRSPLGWTRPASAGNVSIYARTDATATAMVLRLDDSNAGVASATNARASMLETWTDVNTFTGQAPTSAQLSGGVYWPKGTSNATGKKWVLVGDSKAFYLFLESANSAWTGGSYTGLFGVGFGDLVSYKGSDSYNAFLAGYSNSSQNVSCSAFTASNSNTALSNSSGFYLARAHVQTGAAVPALSVAPASTYGGLFGTGNLTYPDPISGSFVLAGPAIVSESAGMRGVLPGLYGCLHANAAIGIHAQPQSNLTGSSKSWLPVSLVGGSITLFGAAFFDITGPWR